MSDDLIKTIVTSVLTSTIVSSAIAALLKFNFDRRLLQLEHNHQIELARTTQQLALSSDVTIQRLKLKEEVFPKILALVYRIRNSARQVMQQPVSSEDAWREIGADASNLNYLIYQHRLVLELDGIFRLIHSYRDRALDFQDALGRLMEGDKKDLRVEDFRQEYEEIDDLHQLIVDAMKTAVRLPSELA